MKQLPALLLLLFGSVPVVAQSFSAGLSPRLMAPIVTDGTVGQGWGAAVWSRVELNNGKGLALQLGWQEIRGYNSAVEILDTRVLPEGSISWLEETARLKRLQMWQIDLSFWQKAWNGNSPLTLEAGVRYSFGVTGTGTYQFRNIYSIGGATTVSSRSLGEEVLRGHDLGIRIAAHYKLQERLSLEAEAYQGFLNQWKDFEGFTGPVGPLLF
ncbi:MAG: hypothetical protein NXI25_05290 [bacterium]|nr:hypothetical protein [bacterium]